MKEKKKKEKGREHHISHFRARIDTHIREGENMSGKSSELKANAMANSDRAFGGRAAAASQLSLTGVSAFHQQRRQWTRAAQRRSKNCQDSGRIPVITRDHDTLLDNIVNCIEFDERVPLPVLVDALNDLWEADGLFE